MFGSLQIAVGKDEDTSDMEYLTLPWRSVYFFVVVNWFILTYAENYDTSLILAP